MAKSILGVRIHALRKEKGVTQEELGRAVGVTAQAVSNWECGGTPDAEILPQIAEYFNVSIDNLYGRTDDVKKNLESEIIWNLHHTETEKRYEKAFQYCCSIQKGLSHIDLDVMTGMLKDGMILPDSTKTSSVFFFEEGVSVMRLNEKVHNFFMMPTPPDDMRSFLLEPEAYEHFFSILGKPGRMKTLFFLHKRKALALTATRLAKHLNMKESEVTEIMQDLIELELIQTIRTDTDHGEETLYRVQEFWAVNVPLIPFLTAATDLIDKPLNVLGNTSNTKESLL